MALCRYEVVMILWISLWVISWAPGWRRYIGNVLSIHQERYLRYIRNDSSIHRERVFGENRARS